MSALLASWAAAGCADGVSRPAGTVVEGGQCHALLELQCECCGGQDRGWCLQYVDDLVRDGEAYSDSSEDECAARRAEAKDVPAWCDATFTTLEAQRRACQGFTSGRWNGQDADVTVSTD